MNATHTPVNSFLYEQCDVPPGKSLQEWRRSVPRESAHGRRSGLMARFHVAPARHRTAAR
jgi:hypothetical protein